LQKQRIIVGSVLFLSSLNIGHPGTSHVLTIVYVGFLLLLGTLKLKLKYTDILFFIMFVIFVFLAKLNDAHLYNMAASIVRFLAFFLLANTYLPRKIEIDEAKKIYAYWLFFGITFFIFQYAMLGVPDKGVMGAPRFSGYMFDPNYFAILSFGLILMIYPKANKWKFHTWPIIFSQSLTVILTMLAMWFSSRRLRRLISYGLILFPLLIYFLSSIISYDDILNLLPSGKYLDQRSISLWIRFDEWGKALDYISENPMYLLFGLGSGNSYMFGDTVLHSYYIQTLIDKGIILYLALTLYVFRKLEIDSRLLFLFSLTSLMFDSFALMLIGTLIFMWNSIYNEPESFEK